jgi:hypothetical protein
MVAEIRRRPQTRPFEPFSIVSSSGQRYRVPTSEHAAIHPKASRVVVWFDDGTSADISGLHIATLEMDAAAK